MPKLPRVTSKKLSRVLLKAGFYMSHQSGNRIGELEKLEWDIFVRSFWLRVHNLDRSLLVV